MAALSQALTEELALQPIVVAAQLRLGRDQFQLHHQVSFLFCFFFTVPWTPQTPLGRVFHIGLVRCFTGFPYEFQAHWTGFCRFESVLTGFYRVLPSFT